MGITRGFLELGGRLRGGEEKVEEVRVGLLGFERGVEEVRGRARAEAERVKVGMEGVREVRRGMRVGRALLEWEDRVSGLEKDLGLRPREGEGGTWTEGMESSDEDEDEVVGRAKLEEEGGMLLDVETFGGEGWEAAPFLDGGASKGQKCERQVAAECGCGDQGRKERDGKAAAAEAAGNDRGMNTSCRRRPHNKEPSRLYACAGRSMLVL